MMNSNRIFFINEFPVIKCPDFIIPREYPKQPVPVEPDIHNFRNRKRIGVIGFVTESKETFTIITLQPVDCRYPNITEGILGNTVDKIRSKSVGTCEMGKRILFRLLGITRRT